MTKYLSCDGSVELTYLNGLLQSILLITEDLVTFDGLKHLIQLYEDDLDRRFFADQITETLKHQQVWQ